MRRCSSLALAALCLIIGAASSAAQVLSVSPTEESAFSGIVRGTYQPFQVPYTLHNGGTGMLQWFATATQPWVYLTGNSGALPSGGEAVLTVSIDVAAANRLGAGTYHADLVVFDLSHGVSTSRSIELTLTSGSSLSIDPSIGFTSYGAAGGAFTPAAQTYAVANLGTTPMSWSASTSASWLTLSESSGLLQPGALASLEVGIDAGAAAALPAGQHTATFVLLDTSSGLGDVSLPVMLSVAATLPPALSVLPAGDFATSGAQGGPFLGSEAYELENQGGQVLTWSASASQPWVRLSATGGILDPGGRQTVQLSIDALAGAQLGLGVHAATALFSNESGGLGSTSRAVALTVQTPTNALLVDPATGLSASGPPGGSFVPDEETYTLTNAGNAALSWSASANVPWILISNSGGTLDGGGQTALMVTLDESALAALAPGSHVGSVFLTNSTAGVGSTMRPVELEVLASSGALTLDPATAFAASGAPGGPLVPPSMVYALRNQSGASLSWLSATTVNWLQLSSYGGTLASGAETSLTVVIDAARTAALADGVHEGYVVFGDPTSSATPLLLKVRLSLASGSATTSASVSQFGITWTFDQPYPVGTFANGDWWVQGPVTIVDIDPPSISSGSRVTNGSMINPDPRFQVQSYDSSMFAQYASSGSYDEEGNVALGVTAADPLLVPPNSSLVSSISRPQAGLRPQLQSAAILTVLPAPAPPGSFRPPYCGGNKTIRFHESQLDWSKLARLHPVGSTPEFDTVEQWFERPWIDHIPDWIGRYLHPTENMPDYGREICDRVGTASLMLNLDFSDAKKRPLLVRLVQLGIDFYGVADRGGRNNWPAGGGHHSGRKWPILFAGLMLNDPDMGLIGFDPGVAFNEDDQTFYVEETSPGVYNYGYGGYGPQHVGLPEWGNQHAKNYGQDSVEWFGNPYRVCCTANVWWGELLAAHIMGARPLWNHQALFDYQDRYLQMATALNQPRWTIGWTNFPLDMWKAYRSQY